MFKSTILALVTVAALGGVAAPAMASSDAIFTGSYADQQRDQSFVAKDLQRNGVNAVSVEEWNGLIRAWVKNDDGTLSQQFFQEHTLAPVSL